MKYRSILFAVFLAVTLFISACSQNQTPPEPTPSAPEQPIGNPLTLDEQFLEVAKFVPEFAGMYYTDEGDLNVLTTGGFSTQSSADVSAVVAQVFGKQILKQPLDPAVLENALSTQSLDKVVPEDAEIVFKSAKHRFTDLAAWRSDLDDIWSQSAVTRIDINELENTIVIGVESAGDIATLRSYVQQKGIPDDAVRIEVQARADAELSLRNNYAQNVGGLQIEYDGSLCTLGFNARLGSVMGFVTNAHCSTRQGVVTPTVYRQGGNQIAREFREAAQWTCGSSRCRWADAAFARYDSGEPFELGSIAYTYFNSNAATEPSASASDLEIRDWQRLGLPYRIKVVQGTNPLMNDYVYKTGRTTGRTGGRVTQTCVDVGQRGTNIVNRCQSIAGYASRGGDSGSPVFKYSYSSTTGWRVALKGIHWGGGGAFSPMTNINSALGGLNVTRPATVRAVYDAAEGSSPDFRKLTVSHTDDLITIDIRFNRSADLANAGHNVYLYGHYRDTINFSRSSFSVRRDYGNDGHFESTRATGSVQQIGSTTLRIQFRSSVMPDIHQKQVWAYSQRSRDRIPNSGHLQMR